MAEQSKTKPDLTPEQLLAEVKLNTPPDNSFKRIWIMLGIIVAMAILTSVTLSIINSKLK